MEDSLIEYLYSVHVRSDLGVESMAEDIRDLIRKANNNKRGEWIDQHYDENMDTWFATCTNCGYTSSDRYIIGGSHFYCERCGAKMKIIKYS